MNKRRIAILLALMLALPGACLADEEAPAEQPAEVQQAEPEAKAEPKAAKEEKEEKPKEAEAAPALIAEVEDGAAEVEASPAQEEAQDSEPAAQSESAPEGDESGEGAGEETGANASDAANGEDGPSFDEPDPADADAEVSPTQDPGESEPGADGDLSDGDGDPGDGADPEGDGEPDPDDPDTPDPDDPDPENPEPAALTISAEGARKTEDGTAWQIPYATPEDEIHFSWTAAEGATEYTWRITDADGSEVATGAQAETSLALKAEKYVSGRFTLTVTTQIAAAESGEGDENEGAEPGGETQTLTSSYTFELKLTDSEKEPSEENPSGNRPSGFGGFGGFGGGSRSSGGSASSAGGAAAQGEQGTQVTPGESLTDDHASGSKDMTAYGTVELSIAKSTQTQLTLGGAELGVALADGESFRAELSGGELILTAEAGEEWRVNGLALEVLARSGVDKLALYCGESGATLSTGLTFQGPVYAACRARGCVAKDFELIASDGGIYVLADGERCALADDGTLVRE